MLKISGSGNIFVVLDNRSGQIKGRLDQFARRVCSSEKTDGLLLVEKADHPQDRHFKMHFFNPDGSEVGLCGNGARCIAFFAASELGMPSEGLSFEVEGMTTSVRADVDLGKRCVSVELAAPVGFRRLEIPPQEIGLPDDAGPLFFVDSGVPHVVAWVGDVSQVDVLRAGSAIRHHAAFRPDGGTNANFVCLEGPEKLVIRTYERGVERETGACGTGAVACSFISALESKVKPTSHRDGQNQYDISLRTHSGEMLRVSFQLDEKRRADHVCLEGGVEVLSRITGLIQESLS